MLKDKLMKHLGKKGAKDLDPLEKEAKMGIASELSRQAGAMMGDKVHPLNKVSVASNTKEGLHHGLQKADAMLKHARGTDSVADHTGTSPDHEHDAEEGSPEEEARESAAEALAEGDLDHDASPAEGSPEEEAGESPAEESQEDVEAEHAHHSPEELDAKIQKLTALKHKKASGRA